MPYFTVIDGEDIVQHISATGAGTTGSPYKMESASGNAIAGSTSNTAVSTASSDTKLTAVSTNTGTTAAQTTTAATNSTSLVTSNSGILTDTNLLVTSNAAQLVDTTAIKGFADISATQAVSTAANTLTSSANSTTLVTSNAGILSDSNTLVTSNAAILVDTTAAKASLASIDTNINQMEADTGAILANSGKPVNLTVNSTFTNSTTPTTVNTGKVFSSSTVTGAWLSFANFFDSINSTAQHQIYSVRLMTNGAYSEAPNITLWLFNDVSNIASIPPHDEDFGIGSNIAAYNSVVEIIPLVAKKSTLTTAGVVDGWILQSNSYDWTVKAGGYTTLYGLLQIESNFNTGAIASSWSVNIDYIRS